jgi:hypothetical integral membrane protein (TIGR02206 family)
MQKLAEAIAYFFGKGDTVEFKNFTLAHFLPIILAAVGIFFIYRYREKLAASKHEPLFRTILAFTMLVCEMSYYWRLSAIPSLGGNAHEHLPITICGWAIIFGAFMLTTKGEKFFDVCYFWVFAGTIFALITPTVITYTGPTRFRYYQFWGEHLFGYVAVFYMMFVHKFRPKVLSMVRAFALLVVLGVVAIMANKMLGPGANYLFVAELEETKSLLDFLPKNYYVRITLMAFVVAAMFVISYLPWFFIDKKKGKILIK